MQTRNTIQKETVERIALKSCDHPSAETIYLRAKEELPSISLGTVYRILQSLVNETKIREISIPSAPSRFDKTTRIHAHFFCRKCGAVEDVEMNEEALLADVKCKNNKLFEEAEICFTGLCVKCNKN